MSIYCELTYSQHGFLELPRQLILDGLLDGPPSNVLIFLEHQAELRETFVSQNAVENFFISSKLSFTYSIQNQYINKIFLSK